MTFIHGSYHTLATYHFNNSCRIPGVGLSNSAVVECSILACTSRSTAGRTTPKIFGIQVQWFAAWDSDAKTNPDLLETSVGSILSRRLLQFTALLYHVAGDMPAHGRTFLGHVSLFRHTYESLHNTLHRLPTSRVASKPFLWLCPAVEMMMHEPISATTQREHY
ncbi:hypothetical protein M405DRAFT_99016 [Rhizopogon salebrosus TDB-379]|nr:hypothetical protein M405DRAFT_99016 [Rhizopogon salebrosus TDB-379]